MVYARLSDSAPESPDQSAARMQFSFEVVDDFGLGVFAKALDAALEVGSIAHVVAVLETVTQSQRGAEKFDLRPEARRGLRVFRAPIIEGDDRADEVVVIAIVVIAIVEVEVEVGGRRAGFVEVVEIGGF